jgi:Helix-turn-helix domain
VRGDRGLLARAAAARQVIGEDPAADPLLMLSFVLWPPEGLTGVLPRRRPAVTHTEVARIFELAAEGLSHRQIGERVGRPRPTVSDVLRRGR